MQFIQAPFTSASPNDEILSGVGMVVCLPPSSLSAVSHPVDFVLQEGGTLDSIANSCCIHSTKQVVSVKCL